MAAELELRWNRALERVAELESRIEKHMSETPARTKISPEQFTTLAFDLKTTWREPTTDVRLKNALSANAIIFRIASERGQST